jgi:hypothetical protein
MANRIDPPPGIGSQTAQPIRWEGRSTPEDERIVGDLDGEPIARLDAEPSTRRAWY